MRIAITVGVLLSAGCGGGSGYEGPQRSAVSGAVRLDGSPLPVGTMTLVGSGGETRNVSGSIENGLYKIDEPNGPTEGTYKVEIYSYQLPASAAARTDLDDDQKSALTKQVIPAKYNKQTTLELVVDGPVVAKDFDLTSK